MNMPEKLLRGVISGLGVKPEDVIAGLNFMVQETRDIKADREAYKAGVQQFVPDIIARMDRIEAAQNQIILALADIQARLPPRVIAVELIEAETINGAIHHAG